MGARLVKFDFIPVENEQIETIVNISEEKRSVIHGIVQDFNGNVVKDAVVKLFEVTEDNKNNMLKPVTHAFTDECGQFIFGPLCPKKKYTIKVWFNEVNIRKLEISAVAPDNNCLSGSIDKNSCICTNVAQQEDE